MTDWMGYRCRLWGVYDISDGHTAPDILVQRGRSALGVCKIRASAPCNAHTTVCHTHTTACHTHTTAGKICGFWHFETKLNIIVLNTYIIIDKSTWYVHLKVKLNEKIIFHDEKNVELNNVRTSGDNLKITIYFPNLKVQKSYFSYPSYRFIRKTVILTTTHIKNFIGWSSGHLSGQRCK